MAAKQTRKTELRKGRESLCLELGQGHVWEIYDGGSSGYPLYDAKEEVVMFDKLFKARLAEGYRVVKDTGLVTKAGPKKPKDMDARTWRWVQNADQILETWRDDDYDNYKDAILDARSMLEAPPEGQASRVTKLEKMLARAEKELAALVRADPEMAEYAKGLLSEGPGPKKRRSKVGGKASTGPKKKTRRKNA